MEKSLDEAWAELEQISEALKDPDVPKKERTEMEERQREVLHLLAMFDTDDD